MPLSPLARTTLQTSLALALVLVALGSSPAPAAGVGAAEHPVTGGQPYEAAASVLGTTRGSLEGQLLQDIQDGAVDDFSLIEAAVVAAGVEDPHRLREVVTQFAELHAPTPGTLCFEQHHATAQAAFRTLHEVFCTAEYRSDASDVAEVLNGGDYNCLSATILYLTLVRRQGLSAVALARKGHVLARVMTQPPLDVETTCPEWFDLPVEAGSDAGRAPKLDEPQRTAALRPLNDVQLLAKVYYNRGVVELRRDRYAEGLRLTRISMVLDPQDQIARGNLLAGLNNWALARCAGGDYSGAADTLAEIRRIQPGYGPLAENDIYVHQQWIARLRRLGRSDQARRMAAAVRRRHPHRFVRQREVRRSARAPAEEVSSAAD